MPTVVTDRERVRRVVEEASRRKRDLAACRRVKQQEAKEQVEALEVDDGLKQIWVSTVIRLWHSVPDATFGTWLSPLMPAGADGQTLFLVAPEGIRSWVERRYASLIREALAAEAEYTEIEFVDSLEGAGTCR